MKLNDLKKESPAILIAEDDPDDRFLIEQAFQEVNLSNKVYFVEDGEELLDYLLWRSKYADMKPSRPKCLLLDLKMPRMGGREALREIRQDPDLADLTVVVLSTSNSDNDRGYCKKFGVHEYMTKPDSFIKLLELADRIKKICT